MEQTGPAPAERGEPAGRPLLSPATRPLAAAIVAACAGTTALLGVWLGHGTHTDPVDTAVDSGIHASLAGHPKLLELLDRLGDLPAIAGITAILVLVCLLRRRYRGAVLLAVSVPAAAVITERLLKPLVGRTLHGFLSFPSGHATGTFALATAIMVLLAGAPAPSRALRLAAAVTAFGVAAGVAATMIAVGLHYFTDAVAGAAVGIGTVLATALLLDLAVQAWRRSGRQPPPAVSAEDRSGQAGAEGSAMRGPALASPAISAHVSANRIHEYLT
jgi:membrane-associated phospholipid phosphatase